MAGVVLRFFAAFKTLSVQGTVLLVACVAGGIWAISQAGQAELVRQTEKHIGIRLDRAARTAAAVIGSRTADALIVTRRGNGQPVGYQAIGGDADTVLQPNARFDALVEEIARVNQGFVNLFRYDSHRGEFVRIATSLRTPEGGYVREVRFGARHPAHASLLGLEPFIGEVPQMGRMRMANLTPILGEHAQVAGALAVDVGWVDDLWLATRDLKAQSERVTLLIIAVVALLGAALLYGAMRPLRKIARYASEVAAGDGRGPVPFLDRGGEIGKLAAGMARVVEMRGRLEKLAYFDALTGKPNRTRFEQLLTAELKSLQDSPRKFAVLLIGIDHFRHINDAFGHIGGDDLLRQVARVIGAELRTEDVVARISSDEFAVMATGVSQSKDARGLAQRCLDRLDRTFTLSQGGDVNISASIGVVMVSNNIASAGEAVRDASLALHKAKATGRRQIQFFTATFNTEAQRKMELQRELRTALDNGHLSLHFQPQIAAETRTLHGVEALARWNHPEQGMISPAEFVPVAEGSGQIIEIGAFVLDEACRTARQWLDCGFDFRHVSVNISPIQLWQPRFDRSIAAALVKHGLPPHCLCLEVTEGVFMNREAARVQDMLSRLAKIGVTLSLDDFGTGYSSLGYLQDLPFSQIKIDRSFVANVEHSPTRRGLLTGIVALGRGLGLQIIAEGVETEEELAVIRELGCDAVQGFYFAKPVPALMIPLEADRIRRMEMPEVANRKPTLRVAN